MPKDNKMANLAFWTNHCRNKMRNQSDIFLFKKAFTPTFDSQNKHVTEQNIISIPLAPNSFTLCYCFFANYSWVKQECSQDNTMPFSEKKNILHHTYKNLNLYIYEMK